MHFFHLKMSGLLVSSRTHKYIRTEHAKDKKKLSGTNNLNMECYLMAQQKTQKYI